jgi:DNA-binding transcriptional LysR family regulator
MQDLNDMLYFAEVVDRGGFTAAGKSLGMTKSRISRRVAELESNLGARLLQRTTRTLSLTDVGETFYRHCQAIREEAKAARHAVTRVQLEPRGVLRIACPVTFAQTTIGPIMPLFLERYPQVTVDLRISNRPVDLVAEAIDIALRSRPTLEDSGSLVVKKISQTQNYLVASPRQFERQKPPKNTYELGGLDTVSMHAVNGRRIWDLTGLNGATYSFSHQPRYIANDLQTLKVAVMRGIGMGNLPEYLCRPEMEAGTLLEVLPGWSPLPTLFHAVFPSHRGMVPAVRRFLQFLEERVLSEGAFLP